MNRILMGMGTGILLMLLSSSCSDNENFVKLEEAGNIEENSMCMEKDDAINTFASILSKAVYENKDLRKFLKTEASRRFDENTDILYGAVKNEAVDGNLSLREILLSYSSEATLSALERSIPLLNILIPEMPMFEISPENMDCEDPEIPVAISVEEGMKLYLDGKEEITVPNGELPAFHTIVVNENSRVELIGETRSGAAVYRFRSPNFDRESNLRKKTRTTECTPGEVGYKAVSAFNYFNKDDNSRYSKALQRDYIYYGMTPSSERGSLNYNVSEYIGFMEVDPKAYYNISDQTDTKDKYSDPHVIKNSVSRKSHDYSADELIKEFWSEGTFTFRFEIITSQNSCPSISLISLAPEELWDFNYYRHVRHKTWFKSRKYTYSIDPRKFTAKKVDLSDKNISFGKWDLSQEATERYVAIYEEDKEATYEYNMSYEMNIMTSSKVNGSIKLGLGTNIGNIGTDINISTSTKKTKSFTMRRSEKDDALGTVKIYFYDPIINRRIGNNYDVMAYNTGIIKFGLCVK